MYPLVTGATAELLERAGAVAATSANLHGGADPRGVEDVPPEILDAVGAVLDVGALPGTPSTVVDLTGPEPRVLREGAIPAAEALRGFLSQQAILSQQPKTASAVSGCAEDP